jgi:serine/threonine protein kinase
LTNHQSESSLNELSTGQPVDSVTDISYKPGPLAIGSVLNQYKIKQILAQSFSGYSYHAEEADTQRKLVIQEYFPVEISVRDVDHKSLLLREESVSNEFEFGLMRFMKLAKALSSAPGKGRVVSVFELNDTAYYVTEFDVHNTLKSILESGHKIAYKTARKWLMACLNFLRLPHQANQLHLGLQTDSLLVDASGDIMLTGFNSVGPSFNIEPDKEEYLYLPIERIKSTAEMRPASDLYSLAAVIMQAMTAEAPPHAAKRIGAIAAGKPDPLNEHLASLQKDYDRDFLRAVWWMLAPQTEDRPRTVDDVLRALDSGVASAQSLARESSPQISSPPVRRATESTLSEQPEQPEQPKVTKPEQPEAAKQVEEAHTDPGLWFGEIETSPQRNLVSHLIHGLRRLLSNPISWLAGILFVLAFAYIWLGDDAATSTDVIINEPTPTINVIDSTAQNTTTTQSQTSGQIKSAIVAESEINLTTQTDTKNLQKFQKLDVLERKLAPYLMEAQTHFASNRLTTPEGSNALGSYRTILQMDPDNVTALQGISTIESRLITLAASALDKNELEQADLITNMVAAINPDNSELSGIREQIAGQLMERQRQIEEKQRLAEEQRKHELAEQQLQQSMQKLLSKAITSYESGRIVEPPANNALYFYRELLKVDSDNVAALTGITQIGMYFVRQSKQALGAGNFDLADRNLSTAAVVDPSNIQIGTIRGQINTRRQLVAQEQQALAEMQRKKEEAELSVQTQFQLNLQSGISAYYRGDYVESYNFLKPLSDRGNARAKFRIAMMMQNGRGVIENKAEARRLFLDALEPIQTTAGNGVAWAQADVGSYYEDGIIMQRNYSEAAKWYFLAAEQGYAGAQTNLGVLFANGHGVQPDMDNAVQWFKRAAIQGDNIAKENLRILGYNPDRIAL